MIPHFLLEAIEAVAAEYSDRLDLTDATLKWEDTSVILYQSDTWHQENHGKIHIYHD